jgi:hypothetical protein
MTSRHEEKLQAPVANGGGPAAAAIRTSTQQEANNKTLLHTSSSKKRVPDECNEPQVQPPPRYLMRLLQAAAPEEREMEKEKKPVQKNTNRHEESAAVAASSSSFQVGSESKGQGLNPSSSGTPPNFVCQMTTTSLPLQAEEKEEVNTDDDDALLPAIVQVPHKFCKETEFSSLVVIFLFGFSILIWGHTITICHFGFPRGGLGIFL